MKRKGELQQDCAEPVCCAKHIEALANSALISCGGSRCHGSYVVREPPPELGGEYKSRIRRHALHPLRCGVGTQRLAKRSRALARAPRFRRQAHLVESLAPVSGRAATRPSL